MKTYHESVSWSKTCVLVTGDHTELCSNHKTPQAAKKHAEAANKVK
jgi:hypothetical protein